jgi:septal ring-binding cell division protein DamX
MTETNGDRGDGDADEELDDRERERRERKRKEAEERRKAEEVKARIIEETRRPDGEREAKGRDSGRIPPPRVDGPGDNIPKLSVAVQQVLRADGIGRHPHEPAPNTPIKRRSTARFDSASNPDQERDKEAAAPVRPAPKTRASSDGVKLMTELLRNSDAILLKLKLHYMRTRSAEMVISFLYDKNIDGEYLR